MKCPRCGFISFDDNETCPKCGNDLSHERNLMDLPSYKPKPLSFLGLSAGDGSSPAGGATARQPDASGGLVSDAQDFLLSLDGLPDGDQEPIQFELDPFISGPQMGMDQREAGDLEDLAISLDEWMDKDLEPIQIEPKPSDSSGEVTIEGKGPDEEWSIPLDDLSEGSPDLIVFEPETEAMPKGEGIEAGNGRDSSVFMNKGGGKGKETAPDLLELELEPLNLAVEIEDPDKKAP